ncbi:hypothetical protein F383_16613 [Gossypium arboreum]|uniref:Uncharacterized protein n=1 Tax=Gossypium arboreum TaxID=29729 RepID=A0A0B0NL58_GOSAR|nr:hypothetical protein F383_16613 [Gossypium arboreum]
MLNVLNLIRHRSR